MNIKRVAFHLCYWNAYYEIQLEDRRISFPEQLLLQVKYVYTLAEVAVIAKW